MGEAQAKIELQYIILKCCHRKKDTALVPSTSIFFATDLSYKTKMLRYDLSLLKPPSYKCRSPNRLHSPISSYKLLLIQADNFALFNPLELNKFLALQKELWEQKFSCQKSTGKALVYWWVSVPYFATERARTVRERSEQMYVLGGLNDNLCEGASLVVQWLRICLPMQGTRVRALVWEDPTCHGATGPVSHNYWACTSGACALQQQRPR